VILFKGRGLTWPLAADLSEAQLQELLFHKAGPEAGVRRWSEPDWTAIHAELKRKHVTLQILYWGTVMRRRTAPVTLPI
jgi:transposase